LDEKQRTILGRASQSAQAFFVKVREGRFFRVFDTGKPKFRGVAKKNLTFTLRGKSENGAARQPILAIVLRFREARGFNI